MAGITHSGGLLADAVFPVEHRRLFRLQVQVQGHLVRGRLEMVRLALEACLPVVDPDVIAIHSRARHSQGAPAGFFIKEKFFARNISEGQVSEIQRVQGPGRPGAGIGTAHPHPKKSELITERLSRLRTQMAGVIPPFGLKLRVGGMVPGKDKFPAREGQTEFLRGLGHGYWDTPKKEAGTEDKTAGASASRPTRCLPEAHACLSSR